MFIYFHLCFIYVSSIFIYFHLLSSISIYVRQHLRDEMCTAFQVVWNPPPLKKKKDAPAKGPVRTSKLASKISYLLSGLLTSLPWEVPFQMHRSCGGKNEPLIYSRLFLLKGPRAERPYHSVFMSQPSEGQCVDSACQRCTVESQRKILAFKIPLGVDA